MKLLQKLGKGFLMILGLFVLLSIIGVGCAIAGVSNDTTREVTKEVNKANYEFIEEPSLENAGYGACYINGVIKNVSADDKDYVQITFTLYDKDGNNIGTAVANSTNVKAEGTWKFKAVGTATGEIASFEMSEITGF